MGPTRWWTRKIICVGGTVQLKYGVGTRFRTVAFRLISVFSIKHLSLLWATGPPAIVPILDLTTSRICLYLLPSGKLKGVQRFGVTMWVSVTFTTYQYSTVAGENIKALPVLQHCEQTCYFLLLFYLLFLNLLMWDPPWYSHMHIQNL